MIMGLLLVNLDSKTRNYMLEELEIEINNSSLYLIPCLRSTGQ